MARYIYFTGGTGYCGCDFEEVMEYPDGTPDEILDIDAQEKAIDNGESFEHVATGWDDDFETDEEREDYYAECWCNWTEITKEEYDEKVAEGM